MKAFLPFGSLWDKVARIEARQSEAQVADAALCEALLDYIRADIEAPWMAPGKRLEKLLAERLKK
jgi:hypothetical protein